jgi:hypothetical protein
LAREQGAAVAGMGAGKPLGHRAFAREPAGSGARRSPVSSPVWWCWP